MDEQKTESYSFEIKCLNCSKTMNVQGLKLLRDPEPQKENGNQNILKDNWIKIPFSFCENCNWRNILIGNSWKIYENVFTPFTKIIKEINFEILPKEFRNYFKSDHINQIAHPLIKKKDIDLLSEKLKKAVKKFFYDPESLTGQERDNIYQNLYRLKLKDLDKKIEKVEAKKRISNHFKSKYFVNPKIAIDVKKPFEFQGVESFITVKSSEILKNLDRVEKKLKILEVGYAFDYNYIDILCEDNNSNLVLIKNTDNKNKFESLCQLQMNLSYVNKFKKSIFEEVEKKEFNKIQGFIICDDLIGSHGFQMALDGSKYEIKLISNSIYKRIEKIIGFDFTNTDEDLMIKEAVEIMLYHRNADFEHFYTHLEFLQEESLSLKNQKFLDRLLKELKPLKEMGFKKRQMFKLKKLFPEWEFEKIR